MPSEPVELRRRSSNGNRKTRGFWCCWWRRCLHWSMGHLGQGTPGRIPRQHRRTTRRSGPGRGGRRARTICALQTKCGAVGQECPSSMASPWWTIRTAPTCIPLSQRHLILQMQPGQKRPSSQRSAFIHGWAILKVCPSYGSSPTQATSCSADLWTLRSRYALHWLPSILPCY